MRRKSPAFQMGSRNSSGAPLIWLFRHRAIIDWGWIEWSIPLRMYWKFTAEPRAPWIGRIRGGLQQRMDQLAQEIRSCTRCPGMKGTQAAPGFGSVRSPVVVVGQSLCRQCMDAQEPFYKGGLLLDKSFAKAGVEKKSSSSPMSSIAIRPRTANRCNFGSGDAVPTCTRNWRLSSPR